jgi:hypothetical protein
VFLLGTLSELYKCHDHLVYLIGNCFLTAQTEFSTLKPTRPRLAKKKREPIRPLSSPVGPDSPFLAAAHQGQRTRRRPHARGPAAGVPSTFLSCARLVILPSRPQLARSACLLRLATQAKQRWTGRRTSGRSGGRASARVGWPRAWPLRSPALTTALRYLGLGDPSRFRIHPTCHSTEYPASPLPSPGNYSHALSVVPERNYFYFAVMRCRLR